MSTPQKDLADLLIRISKRKSELLSYALVNDIDVDTIVNNDQYLESLYQGAERIMKQIFEKEKQIRLAQYLTSPRMRGEVVERYSYGRVHSDL